MSIAERAPVFVPPAPGQHVGTARRRGLGFIGAVAVATATLLSLRRTLGFGATDTIWAEDGRQFYQGTLRHGFFDLLFTPYNGYLHFVPRVLIEVVRIFPLSWAATVIATMAALVTSSCALLVYRASARHLRSPALRMAVAAPVALPYAGVLELINNFACLHFLLLYVAFWMVIWNPADRRLQLLAAVVLFAAVGSDPVAAVYLPLALLRCRAVPGRRGLFPAVAIGIGLAFQTVGIVFRDGLQGRGISPHYDPWWATNLFFQNVIGQGLYTEHLNDRLGDVVPVTDAHYAAWVLGAAALVPALLRVTRPNWPLVTVALVNSLLVFDGLAMQGGSDAPRYEFPAICLFLVAVAGLLVPRRDGAESIRRLVLRAIPGFGALALVALCIWGGYPQDEEMKWRAKGPSFTAQLSQAAEVCRDKSVPDAVISVAPSFVPWTVTVPCDLVRDRDAFFQLSP